jgi:hypothetical protein
MIQASSRRGASAAAIVLAVGLMFATAPVWACGMSSGSSSNGEDHHEPPNGGASTGGGTEDHHGSDDSGRNAGAEGARQGVDTGASNAIDDSEGGGRRSSGGEEDRNRVNQIDAVGRAQAANDQARCRELKAELNRLTGDEAPDPYETVKRGRVLVSRIYGMTPSMLDAQIAAMKASEEEDARSRQDSYDDLASLSHRTALQANRSYSPMLSLMMDYRASLALGIGQEGVKRKMQAALDGAQAQADQKAAEQRARVHDLQAQIAELSCDTFIPTATVTTTNP